jgi:hypothetical protein
MARTSERLSEFKGGERILATNPGLHGALEVLDDMKCSDLGTVLMFHAETKAEQTNCREIIEGNQFNKPSTVSLRDFHFLEGIILDSLSDTEFVDISPLQPFGTSSKIAGTSQKTIMPALRRSEVNSDATTSLFREAYSRYKVGPDNSDVHLATNTRVTRLQAFDPESGFLPHFRIFAQVTVGGGGNRGPEELEALVSHLASEVAILDRLAASERGNIRDINIKIGNMVLTEDLIDRGLVDRSDIRRHTQDPDYNLLKAAGFDVPSTVLIDSHDFHEVMDEIGFNKGNVVIDRFRDVIERQAPELASRITLDLGRVAGIGYYRHICYKINATNNSGLTLPLVDGGTTEWAKIVDLRDKLVHTVTSGIGTELLAKYFILKS